MGIATFRTCDRISCGATIREETDPEAKKKPTHKAVSITVNGKVSEMVDVCDDCLKEIDGLTQRILKRIRRGRKPKAKK